MLKIKLVKDQYSVNPTILNSNDKYHVVGLEKYVVCEFVYVSVRVDVCEC